MKEKNENRFLKLLNFSGNYKYLTILGCTLAAIGTVSLLIPFISIWQVVNELILTSPNFQNATNIEHYALQALIFAILGVILNFTGLMCTHLSAFRNEKNMKNKTLKHLGKLPLGYFTKNTSGGLRKIIDYSTGQTETFLAHQLPDLISAIVTPIIFLILIFTINWTLGIISIIPIILCFLFMIPMFTGNAENFMKEYQRYLEEMNGEAVEYIRGIPVTKAFQQTVYSFKNFLKSIKNYGKFASEYSLSTQLPMTSYTVSINGFFALLIPAGILLAGSTINPKFISTFIFYIIFTPICGVMMNKIMMVSQDWMLASNALENIEKILNEKPLTEVENPKTIENNSIEFKNVYFSYDEKEETLKNINLKIEENQTIALVGPSGGGKTTIASLIPRFWDVDKGEVKIGNTNIKDVKIDTLMDNISFVFQNTRLLKGTILENVKLGEDKSNEEVLKALELGQCMDIIEELPDGINTEIGTEGTYLSGGQQQRISLARAILKDAPIIILDEATALADPENELKIQKAINEITKEKTVILIAHRLSTIKNADKIFVIENGEIREEGNHETLIEKEGLYSKMWNEFNKSLNWEVKSTKGGV